MLWRPGWCGKSELSRIALFLKPIQPSKPVHACGFHPIICMSTIMYCDCVGDDGNLKERMGSCKMLSEQFTQAAQFDITDEVTELLWIELVRLEIVSWTHQLSPPSRVSQERQ